jgi:hypothetical protein
MTKSLYTHDPRFAAGLAAVVLGAVGLLLSVVPILGIPLGAIGLAIGLVGLALSPWGGWTGLRWGIAGVAVSSLALALSVSVAAAPAIYEPRQAIPLDTRAVPDRPYIPPPARPFSRLGWSLALPEHQYPV